MDVGQFVYEDTKFTLSGAFSAWPFFTRVFLARSTQLLCRGHTAKFPRFPWNLTVTKEVSKNGRVLFKDTELCCKV
jgi:hypothetical protein